MTPVGACFDIGPALGPTAGANAVLRPICELPAGHAGAHATASGTQWRMMDPVETADHRALALALVVAGAAFGAAWRLTRRLERLLEGRK